MAENPQNPWFLSKGGVLIMLFLVLGPFGLPFLYKSPAFSKTAKLSWTIAVFLYTAIVVAIIIAMVIYIWRMLGPMFNNQF